LWERPQLARLRDAVRAHEVDVVIAYAIDRLSRDPVHLGVVIGEADHHSVSVEFVTEPLDNSPEGQLIRFVRGYAAKVEHEKIRERSIRGKRARIESGKLLPGCKPLYRYRWRDSERTCYEIDPAMAPVVRRIYRAAAEGHTVVRIAKDLTTEGIPKPTNRGWAR
jgi:site-specific DNA recombinase